MKKESDYFEGSDPQLVYIAKRLRDAVKLESIFTEAGIDYAVEPDQYQGGVVFKTMRVGAFFYVLPETRDTAVAVMRQNNYIPAK